MRYDLSNALHRQQLRTRFEALMKKPQGIVELREVKGIRTGKQNAYLHTILSYFALQIGETADYVKSEYYKREANRATFEYTANDKLTGNPVVRLRSSASLTSEEMTLTIDRFRTWASRVAGIYLPSPDDHEAITQMELEAERAKQWI